MTENENFNSVNLDEFLPMPGAEDILTGSSTSKTTVFSKPKDLDTTFLEAKADAKENEKKKEEETTETEDEKEDLIKAKGIVDDILDITTETNEDGTPKQTQGGKPKTDKSGLVETFSKLIEEGLVDAFDDDKSLEDYTMKDWKELIEANFQSREERIKAEVPESFFKSLPEEFTYAYNYLQNGGNDLKGLFRTLAYVEETRQLDPANENDQETIARNYLRATQFGNAEEIEEEVTTWKDLNTLAKKAAQFKPKLDKMQERVVEQKLREQEAFKLQAQEASEQYMDNIYNTLKTGELSGIKIDNKTQAFLFAELTQSKYPAMRGGNTNLLGHLLEKYQYVEPKYDLVSEVLWLLSDPEGYKKEIRGAAQKEHVLDTVRKLKTEESRKISTSQTEEDTDTLKSRRKIPRQQNIFKR